MGLPRHHASAWRCVVGSTLDNGASDFDDRRSVSKSPSRVASCVADRRRSRDVAAHDAAGDLRDGRASPASGRDPHSPARAGARGRPARLAGPEACAIAGGVGDERDSTTVSTWRLGGGHHVRLPDGQRHRERTRVSRSSKSAAQRWGEDRERHLLQHGPPQRRRRCRHSTEFAPRFVDGHARANRQKPSGIAATESILKWHLVPALGAKRLDAITNEQVQRLKLALAHRAPKTVNNVLTVLSTLLKKAVEWGELDRLPCIDQVVAESRRRRWGFTTSRSTSGC